jgi:hypothetical protein
LVRSSPGRDTFSAASLARDRFWCRADWLGAIVQVPLEGVRQIGSFWWRRFSWTNLACHVQEDSFQQLKTRQTKLEESIASFFFLGAKIRRYRMAEK